MYKPSKNRFLTSLMSSMRSEQLPFKLETIKCNHYQC